MSFQQIIEIIKHVFKLIFKNLPMSAAVKAIVKRPKSRDEFESEIMLHFGKLQKRKMALEPILLQNYDNPNTFNDWLLMYSQKDECFYKFRVTGEAGKWPPKKRSKTFWRSRWMTGYYMNIYQVGEYLGMPALKHIVKVKLWNLDKQEYGMAAGCHIHGRRSKRDAVNKSSAGCTVFKSGKEVADFVEIVKQTKKYKDDKKAKFSYYVCEQKNFPDISGVEHGRKEN